MHGAQHPVHVVCGNAGVGKTTYGAKLAATLGAALFDIDTASERLVRVGLAGYGLSPDDRDSPRYKSLYRDAIHDTLWALAADSLRSVPCVVVAPFTQERRDPDFPASVKNHLGCAVTIHYLWCSDEERRRRIERRGNPRDASKLAEWDAYSDAGRDTTRPPFAHVFVDTTGADDCRP